MTNRDVPSPSSFRADLTILGLFLVMAVAWTWPLGANLSLRIPHDPGDPILNTWILWWNTQAIPFTARWWSPPIFYPMPGAFALSEHLFGIAIFTTPMQWAGLTPLSAYNIALILSFGLSGFFGFLLARRLTGSALAGFCAGMAFGFAPYRASQLSHVQVLTSQWMPLALLAMHAWVDAGRKRWLAVFAIAWLIQALSNGYYLLFFPVLLALWLAWFVDWRNAPRRGIALAATWAASSLLLVPGLLHYLTVQRGLGLTRTPGEMLRFSARLDSFIHAGSLLRFWPSLPGETQEEFLFPGVTALALVVTAAVMSWKRRDGGTERSPFLFYGGAGILMYTLALGPAPEGSALAFVRPYTLLAWLPGFGGLRAPARFAMLAVLCLSVAGGIGFRRLAPSRQAFRWLLAAVVIAGLWVDGWTRAMPLAPAPGRTILPDIQNALVVELPLEEGIVSTAAMYRSMAHGRPLINGYSGYTPPHYAILSIAMKRGDPSALLELSRGRPLLIAVDERYDPKGFYVRMVEALSGAERRGSSTAGTVFVLPASAAVRVAPFGDTIPAAVTELPREHVLMDFGSVRTVRAIAFALRWRYEELGERLAIETSTDGQAWTTAWESWTGGPALAGALENARENPVRITLPDVNARYLRIHPAPRWLARELKVYAPR